MKNVFLSYAHEDARCARDLAKSLKSRGLDVWLEDADIQPGQNWALAIGKALSDADAMVVLLSPDAMESKSVQREIDFALSERRFKNRLIPFVVRPTRKIPWILKNQHMIIAHPRKRPDAFREIADQLLETTA